MRPLLSRMLAFGLGLLLAAALAFALPTPNAHSAARTRAGAASETRLVSQTALGVLRRGGTAVDAVIAAALAAGVVAPSSSGLGGGALALVYSAASRSTTVLDFRETAPAAVDIEAFERRPLPDAERGKLVGVPGEARGLGELHRRFGKRPWAELVAPAEGYARDGFAIEKHLASALTSKEAVRYQRVASLGRSFWPGGKVAILGQRVKRPELARTLHTLAAAGPEALYAGPIAADIVAAAQKFGGALTLADLAGYRVRERKPLTVAWEGYEVATMPPPSGGGIVLAEVLGSFTRAELVDAGARTPLGVHLLAEVMRGALADRTRYVGDPEVQPLDVAGLIAPTRLAARKARISPDRTQLVRALATEDHGTHALVVADAQGNVVSLTTTVNTGFGAEIEGETSGIVLNDQLDDFTPRKATESLGLHFAPNVARPGCRPASSMTPTLVFRDGRPVAAFGGSGGYAIQTNVTEVLLDLLVHGQTPAVAVANPRFFFDPRDYSLVLEGAFSEAVRSDLTRRGEAVKTGDFPTGVQALWFGPTGVLAGADPRKGGAGLAE